MSPDPFRWPPSVLHSSCFKGPTVQNQVLYHQDTTMMHLDPWKAQALCSPTVPFTVPPTPPLMSLFPLFAPSYCLPFEKIKLLSRTKCGPLHHAQRKSSFEANSPFPPHTQKENFLQRFNSLAGDFGSVL